MRSRSLPAGDHDLHDQGWSANDLTRDDFADKSIRDERQTSRSSHPAADAIREHLRLGVRRQKPSRHYQQGATSSEDAYAAQEQVLGG